MFGKDPREYSINAKEFVSDGDGKVKGINTIRVAWEKDSLGAFPCSSVIDEHSLTLAFCTLRKLEDDRGARIGGVLPRRPVRSPSCLLVVRSFSS